MPRHDWHDDDTMTRDRGDWREGPMGRDRDYRGERRPGDSWGGLLGDDRSGSRDRGDYRGRGDDRERGYRDRDDYRGRGRYARSERRDEDRWFGPDDHNRGIPMDETRKLIASNKVEGTPVYDRHGDKLGTIHNFMVDKQQGRVVYAVLKHGGGFLGLNERYYPLEWDQLDYDTRLEGYHVDMDEDDLKNFGSFDSDGRYYRRQTRSERRERRDRW